MENIDNYYIQVELLERYFEVKITPAEFGDWLIARGRYGGWDSGRSVLKGETVWRSYEPGRLERLENGGPETIIGLPFRVSMFLLNEQGHFSSDYRDYTPIQFWLVKRGNWTEVTAVCKPPGAWPETADRLHGMFDWLIDQVEERFGDNFRWVGTGETAVTNQPGAADVGGDGSDGSDGDRETAVTNQPGAADVGGDGGGETAVSPGFNLQTKPAGRKPDRLNDEAYQLLRTQGEQVAFAFWCEGKAIGEPTKTDRSNFKQSMDRAAGRAET